MTMNYGSYVTSSNGIALVPTEAERITTPKGLLVTRAVETKDGWVGQIIVDKSIIWQSAVGLEDEREAVQEATQRVVAGLTALFTDDTDLGPVD